MNAPALANRDKPLPLALAAIAGLLAISWREAYDHITWTLEVLPILLAMPLMWASHRKFPLTTLLYALIFLHALVLILGATYTYARVPLGFQIADLFSLQRNPYDKIGHFFQGFVPALIAREILMRGAHVCGRRMLNFIVVCIVLAISASYELLEWAAALTLGQNADAFLGTQGDPWDTQSDMFCALIGAVVALVALSRVHDRQMQDLAGRAARQ